MPDPPPSGPSTFRPWRVAWQEALYGAGGFYRRADGPRAHFETSANAGGGVVELLAEALVALAGQHGCTTLVDLGAGRGELLTALSGSEALRLVGVDVVPRPLSLAADVDWWVSPGGAALPTELGHPDPLERTLVLAHEWLDVVPCDVLEVDEVDEVDEDRALRVVEVDVDGSERLGAPADREQLDWCARWWPVDDAEQLARGSRVEVGTTRDAAWADLLSRVGSGLCVAVDYGHVRAERPPTGTLAAHRDGHLVRPVPDGSCDLTADVSLDSLPGGGRRITQRAALLELGLSAGRPALGGDPAAYLLDLQRASAAATLLDPGGLGGLSWVICPIGQA